MIQTTSIRPAKKFGPGYFIREQMELRDWTQEDLSEVSGFTIKHLNKVLQDKQALTLNMARVLGEIFNTTAQYWLNLDSSYRLWLLKDKTANEIEVDIKATIYERMPIKDMLSKKWLTPFGTASELEKQVLIFWDWKSLDFTQLDSDYLPYLTRKSDAYNQFNASYAITWYRKALIEAKKLDTVPYKKSELEILYNNLYSYTNKLNGIDLFLTELNKTGVLFLVLPHLQKTYLDGAAFLKGDNPVIVFTGRYKRIDNFWFTVAHEIAHVLLHLNKEIPFILDNLKTGELNTLEIEANELASIKLKHNEILDYLDSYLGYLSNSRVEECAAIYEIHPSIIIGKLAHDSKISYHNQSLYNENVLDLIPARYQRN
ncbi:MAG TPA: ImmA/IrrE family metallo-endopeptidase [Saprospiraceae bacterium]|nr:ImmA/IrrE family metallo-endopeptidase [Saprospiraceae bacterium]